MKNVDEIPSIQLVERRVAALPALEEEVSVAHSGSRSLSIPVFVAVVTAVAAAGIMTAPTGRR